ncbi:MAG: malto-oligosyltrehalose trehalohydrolase [Actinobacteria bacterium]|nr:malto-oligosyltrehalose trehalohydrolase [Actinomycetota bacterium]
MGGGTRSVWVPAASGVELVEGERRTAMDGPDEAGWWTAPAETDGDYAFSIEGRAPVPDPRSPWQPEGVHGPSRPVDHAAFPWTDGHWAGRALDGAVIYELHVGTYSPDGTFAGVARGLDHLVELGVSHVELMPVAEFPGRRGWGYDGVDLYAPHHAYGGPEAFKALVDACHARGLAVLLDVVYNHLGPSGNYLGQLGPYFTDRYATPWGQAVNLDGEDSDEVRAFFIDNALHWLRNYHVDGLRLDAVHAILDTSAFHLLEELAERVDELEAELGRPLALIAESDLNDPRVVQDRDAGGYGMDAQWSDDFHHALHAVLTGETTGYYGDFGTLAQLGKALRHAFVYDGIHSRHRRRRHGRPPAGLPPGRFLAYAQTHDQVGNRARGERLSALVNPARLRMAAALTLCSPFVPMLFQGEEWGAATPFLYFTDHEDSDLGRAVSEARRREFAAFGWKPDEVPDPQDPETFHRSVLDWSEPARDPHAGLLDWHRRLIRLRQEHGLHEAGFESVDVHFDEGDRWLVLDRGRVVVALSLADQPVDVPLGDGGSRGVRLSAGDVEVTATTARLGPDSVVVLA